jgi:hypothetical protein
MIQEPRLTHKQPSPERKVIHNPQPLLSTADNSLEIGDKEQAEA